MGSVIRSIIAYLFLLIMIRVTSRRAAGPATPFQLILIFLFGGLTVQAVVADDRSFINAVLVVITVSWIHRTIALVKTKFPRFGRVVDGTPIVLVEDGHWHEERLRKLQLHPTDVVAAARQRGIGDKDSVRQAVFERNGDITILDE
jgi:uncharacterized membrane protein YcaP (DUF421 family)